jgi:CRP-like cAMP-binding protein
LVTPPPETVLLLLRGTAVLAHVPDAELRALAERIEVELFPAGARIVAEGDPAATWCVIAQGSVDVVTNDLVGQATVLATLGYGETFGEIALVQGGRRTATVFAREDVQLLSLRREAFAEFAAECPAFADQIRSRVDLLEVNTFLRRASPLARLPRAVVLELAGQLDRVRTGTDELIVREGGLGDRMYLVRSGRVEITQQGRSLGYLGVRDCFGEIALLTAGHRTATVRAVEETELLVLPRDVFQKVVGEHATVASLMGELARIRSYVSSVPRRPAPADPFSRLAPIVALDRRRPAWIVLVVGVAAFSVLSAHCALTCRLSQRRL